MTIDKNTSKLLYKKQNITLDDVKKEFMFLYYSQFANTDVNTNIQSLFKFFLRKDDFFNNNYALCVVYNMDYKSIIVEYSAPFMDLFMRTLLDNTDNSQFYQDFYDTYFLKNPVYTSHCYSKTVFLETDSKNYDSLSIFYNKKAAFIHAVDIGSRIDSIKGFSNIDIFKLYKSKRDDYRILDDKNIDSILNIYQYHICPYNIHDYFFNTLYNMLSEDEVNYV